MKNIKVLAFLIISFALMASSVWAAGDDPDMSKPETEEKGTNVRGQSSDFKSYVNDGAGEPKSSNSIDLVDLGEDAKVAVGGDDPSVGVRVGY